MMSPRRGDLVEESGITIGLHVIGNEEATEKFYSTIGDTRWIIGDIDKLSQTVLLMNAKQYYKDLEGIPFFDARKTPGFECYWMDICDLVICFNYDLDYLTPYVAKKSLEKWDD